jgi:hypothetical protein
MVAFGASTQWANFKKVGALGHWVTELIVRKRHPLLDPEGANPTGACRLAPLAEKMAQVLVHESFCAAT